MPPSEQSDHRTEHFEARIEPRKGPEFAGREWLVTIIGPETADDLVRHEGREYVRSKNDRLYACAGLREAAADFDGVRVYDNHLTDAEFQERGGMRSVAGEWIGTIVKPAWDAAERKLRGTLKIVDEALAGKLAAAWDAGVLSTIGLSIDTVPRERAAVIEGRRWPVIEGFQQILSVDLVAEPAAGGRFDRLLAAQMEVTMPFSDEQKTELQEMIATAVAEALPRGNEQEEIAPEEAAQEVADAAQEVADAAPPDADPAAVAQAAADAAQDAADAVEEETEGAAAEALQRVRLLECQLELQAQLGAALSMLGKK